ncbi:hypothetical protein B0H14DRAFT_3679439 [Mycena olivaceomarginata]|nr:hypothetical protein B0H14DRAFT_3679439 [Mycena olivaceomarginata]
MLSPLAPIMLWRSAPPPSFAAVGDTITFTVVSRNHSVTSTSFSGAVCPPPNGGVGPNGLTLAFSPISTARSPLFTYTVVDTVPHFGACKQAAGAHCRAGIDFRHQPELNPDLRTVPRERQGLLN